MTRSGRKEVRGKAAEKAARQAAQITSTSRKTLPTTNANLGGVYSMTAESIRALTEVEAINYLSKGKISGNELINAWMHESFSVYDENGNAVDFIPALVPIGKLISRPENNIRTVKRDEDLEELRASMSGGWDLNAGCLTVKEEKPGGMVPRGGHPSLWEVEGVAFKFTSPMLVLDGHSRTRVGNELNAQRVKGKQPLLITHMKCRIMHGRTPAFVTTLLGYKSNVTSSQAHVKLDLHDKLAHIRRQSKLVDPDKRMHYRERLPLIEGLLKQTSDAEITKSVSTVNRWIRTADVLCDEGMAIIKSCLERGGPVTLTKLYADSRIVGNEKLPTPLAKLNWVRYVCENNDFGKSNDKDNLDRHVQIVNNRTAKLVEVQALYTAHLDNKKTFNDEDLEKLVENVWNERVPEGSQLSDLVQNCIVQDETSHSDSLQENGGNPDGERQVSEGEQLEQLDANRDQEGDGERLVDVDENGDESLGHNPTNEKADDGNSRDVDGTAGETGEKINEDDNTSVNGKGCTLNAPFDCRFIGGEGGQSPFQVSFEVGQHPGRHLPPCHAIYIPSEVFLKDHNLPGIQSYESLLKAFHPSMLVKDKGFILIETIGFQDVLAVSQKFNETLELKGHFSIHDPFIAIDTTPHDLILKKNPEFNVNCIRDTSRHILIFGKQGNVSPLNSHGLTDWESQKTHNVSYFKSADFGKNDARGLPPHVWIHVLRASTLQMEKILVLGAHLPAAASFIKSCLILNRHPIGLVPQEENRTKLTNDYLAWDAEARQKWWNRLCRVNRPLEKLAGFSKKRAKTDAQSDVSGSEVPPHKKKSSFSKNLAAAKK